MLRNDSDTGHRVIIELRGTHPTASASARPCGSKAPFRRAGAPARAGARLSLELRAGAAFRPGRRHAHQAARRCRGRAGRSRSFDEPRRRPAASRSPSHRRRRSRRRRRSNRSTAGRTIHRGEPGDRISRCASREEAVDEAAQQPLLPGPATTAAARVSRSAISTATGATTSCSAARPWIRARILRRPRSRARSPPANAPALAARRGRRRAAAAVRRRWRRQERSAASPRAASSLPAGAPEYQPRLFLNDGHGAFRAGARTTRCRRCRSASGAVAAADFDRDGRLDVFIGGRVLPGQYPLAAAERAARQSRRQIRGCDRRRSRPGCAKSAW